MTEAKDKKTEKAEVTLEEFDKLEAKFNKLAAKVRGMSDNWKAFADKNIGSGADNGKIVGLLLGICLIGSLAFGEPVWRPFDNAVYGNISFTGDSTSQTADAAVSGDLTVSGTVTLSGSVDADSYTCDAAAGLDTQSAGSLVLGAATATSVVLGATDAFTSIAGALKLKTVLKTANYTNTINDCVISYDTSAVTTNFLPEASTALNRVFIIALQDDDGDLAVRTDQTDKFDGTNDILTFEDAADSCAVMATATNTYTILWNVGGTLSN